jgi:GNAT superfamily N-acetyltransferase
MTEVIVRPLDPDDAAECARFVAEIPEGERRFLKEPVEDPVVTFARWRADGHARYLVAARGGHIAGIAASIPGTGWSSHVAEVRLIVSPGHRREGVGRQLAGSALAEAIRLGCTHVYVEVVAEQEALVAMFNDLGFEPEALVRDFVRDGAGEHHDLMLLTHRVEDHLAEMNSLGLDASAG